MPTPKRKPGRKAGWGCSALLKLRKLACSPRRPPAMRETPIGIGQRRPNAARRSRVRTHPVGFPARMGMRPTPALCQPTGRAGAALRRPGWLRLQRRLLIRADTRSGTEPPLPRKGGPRVESHPLGPYCWGASGKLRHFTVSLHTRERVATPTTSESCCRASHREFALVRAREEKTICAAQLFTQLP